MRLSVVIPVYNEKDTLPKIMAEVASVLVDVEKEIIVVDDGSTDGTRDWLKTLGASDGTSRAQIAASEDGIVLLKPSVESPAPTWVKVFFQPTNQGKGAALRKGFELVTHEVIVIQDADLEYDPRDLEEMWRLILRGIADVVYGSRFYGRPHRSLYLHHYMGNWLISRLVNVLCNSTLSDVEVCYKMFRREVLDSMHLTCNDFGFEVEFTVKMLTARKWRIYELGISYYGRTYEEGKKINWRDGLKALWYVVRFRVFR